MIDIVLVIAMTFTITLARPVETLGNERPTASLLGPTVVGSVCGQHAIFLISLAASMLWLQSHEDYIQWGPRDETADPPRPVTASEGRKWWFLGDNWEVTTLFMAIALQLTAAGVIHSLGGRFRLPLYRNYWLCGAATVLYGLFVAMLLAPPSVLSAVFHVASIGFVSTPLWFYLPRHANQPQSLCYVTRVCNNILLQL